MSSRRRGAPKGKHLEYRKREPYFDGETGRLVLARKLFSDQYELIELRRHKGGRKVR